MKKILLILSCLCVAVSLFAVPARPGQFKVTQPDGSTLMIRLHGDEFGHWITDARGRVVRKDADGWWREAQGVNPMQIRRAAANRRESARKNRLRRAASHVAVGEKRFLVVLVEFSDLSFKVSDPRTAFSNLLNQEGYSANGATGSARDFYIDNSKGYFKPTFDVYGPVKLSKTKAYYGGNNSDGDDLHPEEAVAEACKALDGQIDFSRYDNDGNGEVDLVFMYYAGYGEADSDDADSIWPHQWEFSGFTADGKTVSSYACTNELNGNYSDSPDSMCGIGTACHEFGHAMGLPDFYDTDYSTNGLAAGLFDFSTMDGGAYNNDGRTPPYFNIEERILLGWLDESALEEIPASGTYTLGSVQNNKAYKTPTDQEGEYFVYECRNEEGWDEYLPAHGMIVYHVDKSSRKVSIDGAGNVAASELWSNWGQYNAINENGSHPCFYVVSAAGQEDLRFGFEYDETDKEYYFNYNCAPEIPFPGSKNVTSYTAESWNGVDSQVVLSDIAYSGGQVSFKAAVPSAGLDYPVIRNPGGGTYAAGSSFALALDMPEGMTASAVRWSYDGASVSGTSLQLTQGGAHTVEADITLQGGRRMVVTLEIQVK